MEENNKNNGLAIAGMVLGILSILWNPWFLFSIIGVILSSVGLYKTKELGKGKGMAIAGLVCSIVGIIVGIISMVILANAVNTLKSLYY